MENIIYKKSLIYSLLILLMGQFTTVHAGGKEDFNDCRSNTGDFCERSGSCAIQGAAWYQYVTIDKTEKFKTQGWPGLCDMVHVSLVQGTCFPLYAQDDVTANLSNTTYAIIPSISGPLACGGDGGSDTGTNDEICNDGIDNDSDGKTDCADKSDCRKDSFCR